MEYRVIPEENFYLKEIKNTCKLIINLNLNFENLKEKLKEFDSLEATSENNFVKKFKSISKRVAILSPNLKKFLIEKNIESSSFINLYSILSVERLIAEFMDEVIKNKYYNFDYNVYEKDFREFIISKEEQSEKVNNWSEASKKKMITKIKAFLIEAGFLKKEKDGSYKIIKPIVDADVIDEIKTNGNKQILEIMLY
ncbi:DUF1819 family protein [Fusobacterium mortiferum]|uniref:DUF1819 family protein n=1 Tax=Fusobacterium mortiferum TaxID=850 RepID=A0A414PUC3_FUSMR|nr:BrxA family protein [Fusobacterium mortiferum]RHF72153.1 DUF1819 family protein [Fusobacterium mortiferum]